MISKQIFSFNFMFLCSLIEELCTKEENGKTDSNFNFGHECRIIFVRFLQLMAFIFKMFVN